MTLETFVGRFSRGRYISQQEYLEGLFFGVEVWIILLWLFTPMYPGTWSLFNKQRTEFRKDDSILTSSQKTWDLKNTTILWVCELFSSCVCLILKDTFENFKKKRHPLPRKKNILTYVPKYSTINFSVGYILEFGAVFSMLAIHHSYWRSFKMDGLPASTLADSD